MVSSIDSADSGIQQLMAQMYQKMKSADTDGTKGLSQSELSSINPGNDVGGAAFLKSLQSQFNSVDNDGDGQLTANEIASAKPPQGAMGPPPGLDIGGTDQTSSTSSTGSTSSTNSSNPNSIEALLEKLMAKILEEISNVQKKAEMGETGETEKSTAGQNPIDSLTASANTDGVSGLSTKELSAVDTSGNVGKANFINNLIKNFDNIDADKNGQLSASEIAASKATDAQNALNASSVNSSLDSLTKLSESFLQKALSSYQSGGLSGVASSLNIAG